MSLTGNRARRADKETRQQTGTSTTIKGLPPSAGPEIAGYEILQALGQGGMGIVYLAREQALDRLVALKVLPHRLLSDGQALERFLREARALARIEHPNIVPIYATGEQDGLPFFTMAYVEGEPLNDVVAAASGSGDSRFATLFLRRGSGDRRPDLACGMVAQAVAAALGDMHAEGIVHRDIKPGNILIDSKGRPVVVDFGVACDPRSTRLTSDATSPGTLRFMPPEQLAAGGAAAIDVRSDIYSLGVTLFELLTLMPAFPQEQMGSLIDAIRLGDRPRPRDIDRAIPRSLDRIVQKSTALKPDDRYQSAAEMEAALRESINCLADTSGLSGALVTEDLDQALREGTWQGLRPPSGRLALRSTRPVRLQAPVMVGIACAGILFAALWMLLGSESAPGLSTGDAESGTETAPGMAFGGQVATHSPAAAAATPIQPTLQGRRASGFGPGGVDRPGNLRKAIALEVLTRMREFVSTGEPSPLMNATTAFLEDRHEDALGWLSEIAEPTDPVARVVYWQLLVELGDPEQRRLAMRVLSSPHRNPPVVPPEHKPQENRGFRR